MKNDLLISSIVTIGFMFSYFCHGEDRGDVMIRFEDNSVIPLALNRSVIKLSVSFVSSCCGETIGHSTE